MIIDIFDAKLELLKIIIVITVVLCTYMNKLKMNKNWRNLLEGI